MDRRADALLQRSGCELSYARFLVLLHVSDGDGMTQRDLSARLGTSEAAVSRMVAGLARDGYVDVARGTGNRRSLSLTPHGGSRRPPPGRPSATASTGSCGRPAPTRARSRPPCAPSWPPSSSSPPAPSPRRSDVHAWTLLIVTHVVGALTSVVLGGYQVWRRPKGDTRHRLLGRVWVVLILWTAISSFWIRHINEGAFSWLHVLSVVTLVTVTLGVVNAVRGNVPAHRGNMVGGSWVGACGAMVAATAVPGRMIPTYAVAQPSGVLAFVVSVLVVTALPRGRRLPAGRRHRPTRRA